MPPPNTPVVVASCGPGAAELVSPASWLAATAADVLAGPQRLLDLFPGCAGERIPATSDLAAFLDKIAEKHGDGRRVVVLVEGDALVHSILPQVIRRIGRSRCHVIPGIGAPALALARLGLDVEGLAILDGGYSELFPTAEALEAADKIVVLTGSAERWLFACALSTELEVSHATLVFERLSLPGERIHRLPPAGLARLPPPALALVMLLKRGALRDAIAAIRDKDNRAGF